jgi:hypothetical protein
MPGPIDTFPAAIAEDSAASSPDRGPRVDGRPRNALWDIDAERAVLSAILHAATVPPAVSGILTRAHFYAEPCAVLYAAAAQLTAQGAPVDPITLRATLNGALDRIGGMEFIATLIDEVPTAEHAEAYARLVRDRAIRRDLARAGATLAEPALSVGQLAAAVQQIAELQGALACDPSASGGVRSLADYMREPDALRPPTAVVPRLAWAERVTLFASSEGWGKSTLARAGAAAVTTGQPFLDGEAVPPGDVLWARLEESEADTMIGAHRFGADPTRFLVWTPQSADPVAELIARMREHRPVLTVVDSVQELATLADVEHLDDAGQMGRALLSLVLAGRELHTATLWLSQGAKATGRYRNSSWLGHAADVVIEIREPEAGSPVRELTVPKRRLDVFGCRVELDGDRYRLVTGPRDLVRDEAPALKGERKRVLDALTAGMCYSEWQAAYGGNVNTFEYEHRQLRKAGLVEQAAETLLWSPTRFRGEQP